MKDKQFTDTRFYKAAFKGALTHNGYFIYQNEVYHMALDTITPPGVHSIYGYDEAGKKILIERIGEENKSLSNKDTAYQQVLHKMLKYGERVFPKPSININHTRFANLQLKSCFFANPVRRIESVTAKGSAEIYWSHNDRLGLFYSFEFTVRNYEQCYLDRHPDLFKTHDWSASDNKAYADLRQSKHRIHAQLIGKPVSNPHPHSQRREARSGTARLRNCMQAPRFLGNLESDQIQATHVRPIPMSY